MSVYVSVPLSGERAEAGRAIVAGAKEALADAGGRAGDLRVRAVFMDDTAGTGRWDLAATAANARRAVEDAGAVAFIGDLDSGATRVSLPITNQAGMLQVSPGATAPDLTRYVGEGADPDRYRPSDEQTFVRLVPRQGVIVLCARREGESVSDKVLGSPRDDGHEAMSLVLDAVADAGADRGEIIDEALATRNRASRIGMYSVRANGDIDLIGLRRENFQSCP